MCTSPNDINNIQSMTISAPTVITGMVNGMIGGVILVLPLLALDAGTIVSFVVILISGIFSYYSCQLCVKHLGPYSDLDEAILNHFDHSTFMKIFYDLIVFLNLSFLLVLYFDLIVKQWEGMFQYSIANPLANCLVLFILVFIMKYFDFGASLMAYGIISIIGYVIFLALLLATSPEGNKHMEKVGSGAIDMAASMGQAFAIQTFFIPILRKNKYQQNYQIYTLLSYIIGIVVYMYIAYAGAFGVLQRNPFRKNPQTIEEYFERGHWQVISLQVIYLIHLYSVFPEFLLISKKRLFNAIGLEGAKKGQIPVKQIIYSLLLIGLCLGISLSSIKIDDIIEVNGAVIGFFFIYFLPLIMHIKCLYFTENKITAPKQFQIVPISRSETSSETSVRESLITNRESLVAINSEKGQKRGLECYAVRPGLGWMVVDFVMLLGMVGVGGFIMFDGLRSVFFQRD